MKKILMYSILTFSLIIASCSDKEDEEIIEEIDCDVILAKYNSANEAWIASGTLDKDTRYPICETYVSSVLEVMSSRCHEPQTWDDFLKISTYEYTKMSEGSYCDLVVQ